MENETTKLLPGVAEKIDELSKQMGMDESVKTVFEMRSSENGTKELILQSGDWDESKPMFVYDADKPDDTYVFISAESFAALLRTLQELNQENFNLKLEKAIWKHTPVDFQDVWVVAMDTIKKLVEKKKEEGENVTINLDDIVGQIKREHPALFFNINDLIENGTLPDMTSR